MNSESIYQYVKDDQLLINDQLSQYCDLCEYKMNMDFCACGKDE